MQFALIYHANFSWVDVDTMPVYELLWFFNRLVKQKKDENPDEDTGTE